MRNLVASELRTLHKKIVNADRRIALMHVEGKVAEKDPAKRMLRLKIGETADGKPILSPWTRWQEAAAGGMNIHSEPDMNEQMILVSRSGVVGSGSIAQPGTYDEDHKAPSDSSDTAVLDRGKGRIELGPDGVLLRGPVKIEGTVDIEGGHVKHNDKNIGDSHVHPGIKRGPADTDPPKP